MQLDLYLSFWMNSTYKFAEKQSINRGISKGESIFYNYKTRVRKRSAWKDFEKTWVMLNSYMFQICVSFISFWEKQNI